MTRIINTIKLNKKIAYLQKLKSLNKESGLIFNLLDNILNDFIGHKLFTILKFDKINSNLERVYTQANQENTHYKAKKMSLEIFGKFRFLRRALHT